MNRTPAKLQWILLAVLFSGLIASCATVGEEDGDLIDKDDGHDTQGRDDDADDDETASLENDAISVEIWLQPFGYRVSKKTGEVVTETDGFGEKPSLLYYRDGAPLLLERFERKEAIKDGVILYYRTSDDGTARVTLSFETDRSLKVGLNLEKNTQWIWASQKLRLFNGEAIYGLTERLVSSYWDSEVHPKEIGGLDRRGERIPMIVLRSIGIYTPFYHSSRGYGLYVDSTFYGVFDLGRDKPDVLTFSFNSSPEADSALTYHIFHGPSHDAILDEYTARTGRPFVPPLWAFGHWRWRDEHDKVTGDLDGNTINGQVAEDVLKYDELGFPIGIYMIDRPWTPGDEGFAEFAWDDTRFPNAGAMRQSLFDRGYHLIVWIGPWAIGWEEGQNGWEADLYGYHAPHSGNHIDFTNPAAFAWWKDKVAQFSLENDVHGWKLDRADEEQPSTWWDVYWDGRTGAEVRNDYPVIYQHCIWAAMTEAWGDDFVNVYRSGYSGSQQYGIANGGDVRGAVGPDPEDSIDLGLRSAIIAQLRCSFMGFPIWGSNTGGYQEFRNREVFARWLEFSTFCPLMDVGGTGAHAPWDMPTDPAYDEEMIDICRTYTQLHHDLAEYAHEYAQGSAQTGRPISRPLVFDYPDDPEVKDMWDEYFYGPDILVAPVWKTGQTEREVYLPEGRFVDYWNPQTVVVGPEKLTVDAPLEKIAIYIREGATLLGRTW